jgi:predicted membrane protein
LLNLFPFPPGSLAIRSLLFLLAMTVTSHSGERLDVLGIPNLFGDTAKDSASPPGLLLRDPSYIQDRGPRAPEALLLPVQAGGGVALAFLGGVIGVGVATVFSNSCEDDHFCGSGGLLLGGTMALMVGAPLGVYLVGEAGHHEGGLVPTVLGSVLGLCATGPILFNTRVGNSAAGFLTVLVGGPVLGGMLMYGVSDYFTVRTSLDPGLHGPSQPRPASTSFKDFRTDIQVVLLRL